MARTPARGARLRHASLNAANHSENAFAPTFTKSVVTQKTRASAKKFKNALMLVGLPGVGLVSKMAVDHLSRETKAELLATMYSPHFPNQVLALKNGRLKAFSLRFYHSKIKNCDAVFLRGDLQPLTVEGQYEVTASALEYAKKLGVNTVIAMAGYAAPGKKGKPLVYAASSHKTMQKKMLALGAKNVAGVVPIVGMAGLVPALSKVYGMRGACLLVETPGSTIDVTGAKTLVEFVGKLVGQKFDSKQLEKRAEKVEKIVRKMQGGAHAAAPAAVPAKASAPADSEAIPKDYLSYIR